MPPSDTTLDAALSRRDALATRDAEADATTAASTRGLARLSAGDRSLALEARIPDLLHSERVVTVDAERLRSLLDFAFAGGDTNGGFHRMLRQAEVAPSDWDGGCFATDLFVEDFVETCMPPPVSGDAAPHDRAFLARVLSHPPRSRETVRFRRAILRELSDDAALATRLELCHRHLQDVRARLDAGGVPSHHERVRRRLDTLLAIRDSLDALAEGFGDCESGLCRLHEYAGLVRATDEYARLVEILSFEDDLASVNLTLRLGVDGRVRQLDVVSAHENEHNRFYSSPLGRLATRISFWLRGYRVGNEELVDRWVDGIFDGIAKFLPPLFQLIGDLELYLAALRFAKSSRERGLAVCFPDLVERTDEAPYEIHDLFNPLLFAQGVRPVPCDLRAERGQMTIVTGPNSGGKTRLLQAIGLAQMLGQCGLFVPARSARLRRADGLFVSIDEAPEVGRREGRLGTELLRIRRLFEEALPGSMVILDELCSGTNPSEGEELFQLVLSLLGELEPQVFISTHFLQLAERLHAQEEGGLSFLQVELDGDSHPTYGFRPGVASTSLAKQTAARLGVTRGELLELVRRHRGRR